MIRLSPSSLERYVLCPGSYWAEQGLPYEEHEGAAEGKLLHAVLGGSATEEAIKSLTRAQKADIDYCKREAKILHEEILDGLQVDKWNQEQRLQVKAGDSVTISGQIDYYATKGQRGLIIDWKFGRDPVDMAQANLQLRAYAVILALGIEGLHEATITVAIVQPRVPLDQRVSTVTYSPDDIAAAIEEIQDIAAAIEHCRDQRTPSRDACRYCKALGTARCPESLETAKLLAPLTLHDVMPNPEALGQALDLAVVAEDVIGRLREYAKDHLQNGGTIPGWTLKAGNKIRTLPDTSKAWGCAQGILSAEEFMATCKTGVGALETAMANKRGWTKQEARANFDSIMEPAIVQSENAPSLTREKREKQLVLVGGQPK